MDRGVAGGAAGARPPVCAPHRRHRLPGAVGHGIDRASGRVGDPGAVPVPVRALDASAEELADLAAAARDAPVEVHPFSGDFTAWLEPAALSISRCGYNTSTALLRSRVPAVVVPARGIADQSMRAALLADRGLAVAVERDTDVGALRAAMDAALEGPRPSHDFDLNGAPATRRALEELVSR